MLLATGETVMGLFSLVIGIIVVGMLVLGLVLYVIHKFDF